MKASASVTITILDLEGIYEIMDECLGAVPEWERAQLQERLDVIIARAKEHRGIREP